MRALLIAAVVIAVAGEARADDLVAECVDRTRAWLAKNPGPIEGPSDEVELVVASPTRVLFRCGDGAGHAEAVVAARRDGGRWRVEPLGELRCATYRPMAGAVSIEHKDSCPTRYYHPAPCVEHRSRVTWGKRGAGLARVSTRRKPICALCPDSTAVARCLGKARRAARADFDAGQVTRAAKLLRAALDHVADFAINSEGVAVDPRAINDALFYSARARLRCLAIAERWERLAATTTRARKALEANKKRCRRLEPKR